MPLLKCPRAVVQNHPYTCFPLTISNADFGSYRCACRLSYPVNPLAYVVAPSGLESALGLFWFPWANFAQKYGALPCLDTTIITTTFYSAHLPIGSHVPNYPRVLESARSGCSIDQQVICYINKQLDCSSAHRFKARFAPFMFVLDLRASDPSMDHEPRLNSTCCSSKQKQSHDTNSHFASPSRSPNRDLYSAVPLARPLATEICPTKVGL